MTPFLKLTNHGIASVFRYLGQNKTMIVFSHAAKSRGSEYINTDINLGSGRLVNIFPIFNLIKINIVVFYWLYKYQTLCVYKPMRLYNHQSIRLSV